LPTRLWPFFVSTYGTMCGPLGTVTELDSNSNADELFKLDGLSGLPLKNVCDGEGEWFDMYLL